MKLDGNRFVTKGIESEIMAILIGKVVEEYFLPIKLLICANSCGNVFCLILK